MKFSKILVTSLFLVQTVSSQAFAIDQSLLDKALAWVKEQQKQAAPATPAPAKPQVQQKIEIQEPKELESPASATDTNDTVADVEADDDTVSAPPVAAQPAVVAQPKPQVQSQAGATFDSKSSALSFGFMHTKQNCKVVENGLEHKSTYCTMDDTKNATELSGMVDAITKQLDTVKDNPKTAKVSIAYFSFSNKGVQRKLCELSNAGVQIRVFLDAGSSGQIDELVTMNPACKDATGKLNVKLSYLGGSTNGGAGGIWRLHHNKFLMIDPGTGEKVKLNFSSGNLSTFGTSLHLDHWVPMEAPATSNIINAQKCVMKGLEEASRINDHETSGADANEDDYKISQGYINTRENCFDQNQVLPRVSAGSIQSQIYSILKKEEIAPLFSPNNNNYVATSFVSAINKIPSGGYLYIAIQHFLHGGVKNALLSAAQRGVDVRLIMDDDALKGHSEVPGVDVMISDLISQSGGQIQIRLAETNHNAGGNGAMMHNKLAILNGEMSFSGAGHYTNAALKNNWENFYFVTNKGVLSSYAKYFTFLWNESVDIKYTKSNGQTPSSAPSKLAPAFINLAQ